VEQSSRGLFRILSQCFLVKWRETLKAVVRTKSFRFAILTNDIRTRKTANQSTGSSVSLLEGNIKIAVTNFIAYCTLCWTGELFCGDLVRFSRSTREISLLDEKLSRFYVYVPSNGLLPSGFPNNILYTFLQPHHATPISYLIILSLQSIWWRTGLQIIQPLIAVSLHKVMKLFLVLEIR
jgi:hypothetical protein